jgi:hypothetical protein
MNRFIAHFTQLALETEGAHIDDNSANYPFNIPVGDDVRAIFVLLSSKTIIAHCNPC